MTSQERIEKLTAELLGERRGKEAAERTAATAVELARRMSSERHRAQDLLTEAHKELSEVWRSRAEAASYEPPTPKVQAKSWRSSKRRSR